MQRYFREWGVSRWPQWLRVILDIGFVVVSFIVIGCFFEFLMDFNAWSEYKQAQMDTRTFRLTTCRIEEIILEEIRSDKNKELPTTLINASFLLKVLNSNNKQDQFRLAEVPALHEPDQHSLVNSSLTCFYDPTGLKQARLAIPNLSKAEHTFKLWCFATIITSITSFLVISYYIVILFNKVHRFIKSRHRVTAPIAMQPINFG